MISPTAPPIQPCTESRKLRGPKYSSRHSWVDHESPPSDVLRTTQPNHRETISYRIATAQPYLRSSMNSPVISSRMPGFCPVQLCPPLVVCRIVPVSPAPHP